MQNAPQSLKLHFTLVVNFITNAKCNIAVHFALVVDSTTNAKCIEIAKLGAFAVVLTHFWWFEK